MFGSSAGSEAHLSLFTSFFVKINVQHSTMSSVLPFDIIAQIIDVVGEMKDTNLLKELSLISHSFLPICSKHLFATVELHDAFPRFHVASSKKGFVKLLKTRPDVIKYIRKLTYKVGECYHFQSVPAVYPNFGNDDRDLSPILPNLLRKISRLNSLTIIGSKWDWNILDSSLTSAFLYLMHLPTINHIDLSSIQDFPLFSFTPSVNLRRFDISYLMRFDRSEEDSSPEIVVQSEMMPQIREFHTTSSEMVTTKLLRAKRQDGSPAFNFTDLRRLSIWLEDEWNLRYFLQNAKLLENLHLSVRPEGSLVGLHDILSSIARTLKFLDFRVSLSDSTTSPLAGLCGELEAMAGHNVLETLSVRVDIDGNETEDFIGSIVQNVETVLIKPGWPALRQVSLRLSIACCLVSRDDSAKLSEALQSLPDKYLSLLSKLESVTFSYSAYVVKCTYEY